MQVWLPFSLVAGMGYFYLKEITGIVSERAVRLGGAAKTEEIKNMAAEMQMCASLAAVFVGCWDGVFLSEKEITGTVSERAVRLGGAAKTEEIKSTAAELQMCASLAAVF